MNYIPFMQLYAKKDVQLIKNNCFQECNKRIKMQESKLGTLFNFWYNNNNNKLGNIFFKSLQVISCCPN